MDEEMTKEVMKRFLGTNLKDPVYFTNVVIDELGRDFSIPPDRHPTVQALLEVAAHQWTRESAQAKIDLKAVRLELDQLSKTISKLTQKIDSMSEETWKMITESGFWLSSSETPLPKVIQQDADDASTDFRTLHFADEASGAVEEVKLGSLRQMLSALAECSVSAKFLAGAGRPGRPNDDAMFDLLHVAFHVWVTVLDRSFEMVWAPNGGAVSPIADFFVRVSHVVDSGIPVQRIAFSARKIREKLQDYKSLCESDQNIDEYYKRFE